MYSQKPINLLAFSLFDCSFLTTNSFCSARSSRASHVFFCIPCLVTSGHTLNFFFSHSYRFFPQILKPFSYLKRKFPFEKNTEIEATIASQAQTSFCCSWRPFSHPTVFGCRSRNENGAHGTRKIRKGERKVVYGESVRQSCGREKATRSLPRTH